MFSFYIFIFLYTWLFIKPYGNGRANRSKKLITYVLPLQIKHNSYLTYKKENLYQVIHKGFLKERREMQ